MTVTSELEGADWFLGRPLPGGVTASRVGLTVIIDDPSLGPRPVGLRFTDLVAAPGPQPDRPMTARLVLLTGAVLGHAFVVGRPSGPSITPSVARCASMASRAASTTRGWSQATAASSSDC